MSAVELFAKWLEAHKDDPASVTNALAMLKLEPIKSIWDMGLPPLGKRTSGSSTPSISKDHLPATATVSSFKLLDINPNPDTSSGAWAMLQGLAALSWSNEAEIARHVQVVVEEVLAIMGLRHTHRVIPEIGIFGIRPDLWIVTAQGVPICVIEIKMPSEDDTDTSVLNNPMVHGQMFDYLQLLSSFYGLQWCFGILSTYKAWRVFWLGDAENNANAALENGGGGGGSMPVTLPELPTRAGASPTKLSQKALKKAMQKNKHKLETEPIARNFKCSPIYVNKIEIPKVIATCIRKASLSPLATRNLVDLDRPYVFISSTKWVWRCLPAGFALNYEKLPTFSTQNFFLIRSFGTGGKDGRVWMASSESGRVCVVKLFKSSKTPAEVQAEAKIWRDIWDLNAWYTQLALRAAIVMPLLRQSKSLSSTEIEAVRVGITHLGNKGYLHNDLKWEHIGFYNRRQVTYAVTLDNIDVVHAPGTSQLNTEYMLNKLFPKQQDTEATTTAPHTSEKSTSQTAPQVTTPQTTPIAPQAATLQTTPIAPQATTIFKSISSRRKK